ncbi:MAG: sugar ABC transporter substrate-binding protein [Alicyclobacillus sp.]|nr:sugar ABC transporter substrate-binding protein [Alicyclobacillus sp.]
MKRRVGYGLTALALAGSAMLAGCGGAAGTAGNGAVGGSAADPAVQGAARKLTGPQDKPRIAVVSLFADDQWSAQFLGGIEDTARKYGIPLSESQASYNQSEMVTQLQTAIAQHPKVIIVNHAANSAALAPAIQKALRAGIKVITEDVTVSPQPGLAQASQDDAQLARLSLNALGKAIHYKGNIAVVWVGGFAPMERRMVVLKQFLKQHPGIHVVAQYGDASNTTVQDTMSRTEAVLRQYGPGKLAAIWASWDQFAIGAVQAVEDLHRNVPVFSIDLSGQDISMMGQKGSPWKATAGTDVYQYGVAVMRYAILAAYGQKIPASIRFPGALVTQSDLPPQNVSIHQYLLKKNPSEDKIGNPALVDKLTGSKSAAH